MTFEAYQKIRSALEDSRTMVFEQQPICCAERSLKDYRLDRLNLAIAELSQSFNNNPSVVLVK